MMNTTTGIAGPAPQSQRSLLVQGIRDWIDAGFAVVPIRTNGSKAPTVPWGEIAKGAASPPDRDWLIDQVLRGELDGIGVITGAVSGNAEVLEIEGRAANRFEELAGFASELGLGDLFQRLNSGCVESSPSGGTHFYYRLSDGHAKSNTVLARRPNPLEPDKPLVLAETRGQGGYMICSPSFGRTHESGKPYEIRVGSPANTPHLTVAERDELFRLFSLLDEMPVVPAVEVPSAQSAGRVSLPNQNRHSPGDDFNARAEWKDILVGWEPVMTSPDPAGGERVHWRRPGKKIGTSATTSGSDEWLYVFSTSTNLPSEKGLSKFAAYTYLNHAGDFKAAAAALAAAGFGTAGRGGTESSAELLLYRPFPTELLPEPVRSFVQESADAANCDPAHVAMPALAAIAGAIGNSRQLVLKDSWKVPPTLWTATVGDSGSKKSVGSRHALGPVVANELLKDRRYRQERREHEREHAVWEREMQQWKKQRGGGAPPEEPIPPRAERVLVDDTTLEALAPLLKDNPRGLLLAKDELRGWLGSFDKYSSTSAGGSDESHWLSMYNSAPMVIDRKTGKYPSIHVPRATVSITGNIPPGVLGRAFNKKRRESGLAARFLLSCPPKRCVQWTEKTISEGVKRAYEQLFVRLYGLQGRPEFEDGMAPIDVTPNPAAKQAWTVFYDRHNTEMKELVGDLAAAWSKLEETAARLALVIHVARCEAGGQQLNPMILDEASMEAGILLVEWFKYETRRVYAMLGEGEAEEESRRLVEWLDRNGGSATVREVQQKCSWLKSSGLAEKALQALVDQGRGEWESSGEGKGRPSKRLRLIGG